MIFWKSKILLVDMEASYGADAGPAGADAVLAANVSLSPMEGQDVEREVEMAYFGSLGSQPVDLHAKLSLEVELAGSGTAGIAPALGRLMRACACAETIDAGVSVTYNPITDGQESASIHFYVGATRFVLLGARGNAVLDCTASGIPVLRCELTGLFTQPSEQARPTPDFSDWMPAQAVTSANTPTISLGGTAMVMRSLALDLGNSVEPRFRVGDERVLITDKAPRIDLRVDAVPLTTLNPFQAAADRTALDVTLVHGTAAGNVVTINAPTAQLQRPSGIEVEQNVVEWPLRLTPRPTLGSDDWTITFT